MNYLLTANLPFSDKGVDIIVFPKLELLINTANLPSLKGALCRSYSNSMHKGTHLHHLQKDDDNLY